MSLNTVELKLVKHFQEFEPSVLKDIKPHLFNEDIDESYESTKAAFESLTEKGYLNKYWFILDELEESMIDIEESEVGDYKNYGVETYYSYEGTNKIYDVSVEGVCARLSSEICEVA